VKIEHLPVTCQVYVEEQDLFGTAEPFGCDVRVKVLSNDGTTATVRVDDSGVNATWGQVHTVPSSALNGGRL
jgi:hypothetical protein